MIGYKLPTGLEEKQFDDGQKWYSYQGKSILSVSRILNRIYPLPPNLDPFYLERGRLIHAATVLIDTGTLDWENLDDRLLPFCSAYSDFFQITKLIVEASELVVVMEDYSFGARIDRVYRLVGRDRLIVADIKTGMGREDRYWLQVAAGALALAGNKVADLDLAILNLGKNGRPKLTIDKYPWMWVEKFKKILKEVA